LVCEDFSLAGLRYHRTLAGRSLCPTIAFAIQAVVGFFIAAIDPDIQPIAEGILFALLTLSPCAIPTGWKEPKFPIPILAMTKVSGGMPA